MVEGPSFPKTAGLTGTESPLSFSDSRGRSVPAPYNGSNLHRGDSGPAVGDSNGKEWVSWATAQRGYLPTLAYADSSGFVAQLTASFAPASVVASAAFVR